MSIIRIIRDLWASGYVSVMYATREAHDLKVPYCQYRR